MSKSTKIEQDLLVQMINGLDSLVDEAKIRLVNTVVTYFNLGEAVGIAPALRTFSSPIKGSSIDISSQSQMPGPTSGFSDHPELSPKAFLAEKQPRTDVDRVACLAYYLSHYRDTPHFKTVDISKLNTEGAQRKFSNATYAVNNAAQKGLVVTAGKATKQISAFGENYVDAMPIREAVKSVVDRHRQSAGRRRAKRKKSKKKISRASS